MENKHADLWFLKAPNEGRVLARFATLGVPDRDQDLILPGAIGEQRVRVSAYGHGSWGGALPVGVGRAFERGNEAIADLEFFTQTTHGRDHFNTIRGLGSLGEWSFGFDILEKAAPTEEQRQAGVMRVLKRLKIHEVSPVLQAAGIGTATLSAKCDGCGVGPAPPAPVGLTSARATLAAAGEMLNGSDPGNGRGLAEFAAFLGHTLNGCPGRIREPAIKFFSPGETSCTDGYIQPGVPVTHVASDLTGEALVRVVLHEAKHHSQADPRAPEAEAAAAAFARRWARPVFQAYRWTAGQPHRVHTSLARNPPFPGVHRYGDVVLCRGRAWALSGQTVNPWTTIG